MPLEELRKGKFTQDNQQFCPIQEIPLLHFWFESTSILPPLSAAIGSYHPQPPSICIRKFKTPSCLLCQGITVETVKHFLLDCPHYRRERHKLQLKLWWNTSSLSFLLSSPVAVLPLLKFVHSTGQFKAFFGKDKRDQILTNSRRNAELRTGLGVIVRNAQERVCNLPQAQADHPL